MSDTVFAVSSSLLNSRLKDRTFEVRLGPMSDEYVFCSFVAAIFKSTSDKCSRHSGYRKLNVADTKWRVNAALQNDSSAVPSLPCSAVSTIAKIYES